MVGSKRPLGQPPPPVRPGASKPPCKGKGKGKGRGRGEGKGPLGRPLPGGPHRSLTGLVPTPVHLQRVPEIIRGLEEVLPGADLLDGVARARPGRPFFKRATHLVGPLKGVQAR